MESFSSLQPVGRLPHTCVADEPAGEGGRARLDLMWPAAMPSGICVSQYLYGWRPLRPCLPQSQTRHGAVAGMRLERSLATVRRETSDDDEAGAACHVSSIFLSEFGSSPTGVVHRQTDSFQSGQTRGPDDVLSRRFGSTRAHAAAHMAMPHQQTGVSCKV